MLAKFNAMYAQNQFEKRLNMHPSSYNNCKSIVEFSNGNYFTCGYTLYTRPINSIFSGEAVYYFLNSNGDTLKTFELYKNDTSFYHLFSQGNVSEFEHCIVNQTNSTIAVAAVRGKMATNQYDVDIVVMKVNNQGDTLLTKQISHPNDSALTPYYILQTYDGNYLITGHQWSFYSSKTCAFVMKLDTNFNVLWRKSFIHPTKSTYFWKALESPDHGVFLSGSDYNNNLNISDPVLVKIDSSGFELWRDNFTSLGKDYGVEIVTTQDGNFMLSTTLTQTNSAPNDSTIFRYIKFNNSGTILTTKNYFHSYADGVFIENNNTGSIITSGWLKTSSTQQHDVFVMKLDVNGDSLWSRRYGGLNDDKVWDMAPTSDGGIILCGETYSNLIPNTNSNAWLLKLDSLGLLITGVNELSWSNNIIMDAAFPNPSNTHCNIHTYIPENISNKNLGKTGYELQLYNLQSKPIQYIPINSGSVTTILNTEQLASGTYLVVLVVNGYNVKNQKIVVIK